MIPLRPQRTIARSAAVNGFGYWSGQDVQVEFRPGPPESGVAFFLAMAGEDVALRIPAQLSLREDLARRTVLRSGDSRVEMIEHVLAALAGLQIDNCEVWVTAEEMPGCDGSSAPFVEALDSAGIVEQPPLTQPLVVSKTIRCGDEDHWIEAQPTQRDILSIEFHLDYGPDNAIGRQSFAAEISVEAFRLEIAPARTFLLREEAETMVAQGKGTRVSHSDLLIFDGSGPIDNPLRFPDECVRHKMLDVVGDLALTGRPVVAHIVAYRSGHQLNGALAEALVEHDHQNAEQRRRSA